MLLDAVLLTITFVFGSVSSKELEANAIKPCAVVIRRSNEVEHLPELWKQLPDYTLPLSNTPVGAALP